MGERYPLTETLRDEEVIRGDRINKVVFQIGESAHYGLYIFDKNSKCHKYLVIILNSFWYKFGCNNISIYGGFPPCNNFSCCMTHKALSLILVVPSFSPTIGRLHPELLHSNFLVR